MILGHKLSISPYNIESLHEARQPAVLAELEGDMRQNGWQGRPLLVVETSKGYQAWTGSHRIEAAQRAGLSAVPCYVIPESLLLEHGVDARTGHVHDFDRLAILRKLEDETAILLMVQEGRL